MPAAQYDIVIEQGAKYLKVFSYKDEDGVAVPLTGFEARMHIREALDSTGILLELTTANGRIILEEGGNTGEIKLYIGATDTEVIDWVAGTYDLELVETADLDNVIRLLKGSVEVDLEVTR